MSWLSSKTDVIQLFIFLKNFEAAEEDSNSDSDSSPNIVYDGGEAWH